MISSHLHSHPPHEVVPPNHHHRMLNQLVSIGYRINNTNMSFNSDRSIYPSPSTSYSSNATLIEDI